MVAIPRFVELARLEPVGVEEGSTWLRLCSGTLTLRKFQEEVLREAFLAAKGEGPRLVLLEAPTGAGKTLALLAPLAAAGQGAIGVYPSRELARDQMQSLAHLLEAAGCERLSGGPLSVHAAYRVTLQLEGRPWSLGGGVREAVLHLVEVTSESLDRLIRALGYGSRGEALRGVREALARGLLRGEPAIVFTVPEYPYLLLEAAYRGFDEAGALQSLILEKLSRGPISPTALEAVLRRALARRELLENLRSYAALVGAAMFLDEFHAYTRGQEETVAALAAAALSEYRSHGLVVAASATPRRRAEEALEELASTLGASTVRVAARSCSPGPGCALVRRKARLYAVLVSVRRGGAAGYALAQKAMGQAAVEALAHASEALAGCGGWRRAMVFVDRVAYVYQAAEQLVKEAGYKPEEIACVTSLRRGYSHPACRAPGPRQARVVIGNEAISYGIDIPEVDVVVVYSRDPMQALQRIGRAGRRPYPCVAMVYLVFPAFAGGELPTRNSLDYPGLAELLQAILPGVPRPFEELLRPHASLRASVFLGLYVAVKAKAAGMLGTSDEALNKSLESLASLTGENLDTVARLYRERYAVGGEALYRALSLRGGLTARLCSGDSVYEADLLVAARNLELDHDPAAGCLQAGRPRPYSWLGIRAGASTLRKLEKLDGAVVSLGLVSELAGDAYLIQYPSDRPPLDRLSQLTGSGAIDPRQPVLVHTPSPSREDGVRGWQDVLEAAAAQGEAILLVDKGTLTPRGALIPL